MRLSWPAGVNVAAKLTLAGLIAFYLLRPDLEQFTGKVMPLRATLFPLAAALVAILWLLRGRPSPFPHLPDALVTLAAIVDFGGNAADLYRFEWFDHAVHFTNMLLLAVAFGLVLASLELPRWAKAGLVLGFGSVLHTIWEIVEFWLVELFGADLDVEAMTTIIDFAAGLAGSAIGAAITWRWTADRVDLGGRLLGDQASRSSRTSPKRTPSTHSP
jgi:hypothetical protein